MTKKLPVEKLDRTRAFGEVYGEPAHRIAFTQRAMGIEGWPYDAQGALIEIALNDEQRTKLDERRALAEKQPQEEPAPLAVDDAQALADLEDEDDRAAKDNDETEAVNFAMWLKGEVRYKPFELQKAGKARFGVNKQPNALALYLIEEKKLVPLNEVAPAIRQLLPAAMRS